MPKQINTYAFGQALVRKFGLKGRFQPVLDETIVPVTVVESEIATRLAVGGAISTAAGAGNQGIVIMGNPAGSGVNVVIQRWWAVSGAPLTDFVQVIPFKTGASLTGFKVWRDTETAGEPKAGFTTATPASVVLGGPQYHLDTDSIVWEEEWVIRPGHILHFRQSAVNTTLSVWVDWYETAVTASLGA